MVDEVLHEFRGELRIEDIYKMTYKELGYLREHRRLMMSDPKQQQAEVAETLMNMV